MKKIVLVISLLALMLLPNTNVSADSNSKAKVYLFRGEGCPHCEEAIEWFNSIEEEYGKYFELKTYEVWSNQNNKDLMNKVAEVMKDNVTGVPYIVLGEHSYKGFDKEKMAEEIKKYIKEEYAKETDERYDAVEIALAPKPRNVVVDVVVVASLIALVGGILFIRYKNK